MFDLFKKFAWASLLLFLVIFAAAFFILPRLSKATFINHQSLKNQEMGQLILHTRAFTDLLTAEATALNDAAIASLERGTTIVGVRLYSPDESPVYPAAVSRGVASSFQAALTGSPVDGVLLAESGEPARRVKTLLQTYSPVQNEAGQIIGVLELKTDVSALLQKTQTRIYTLLFLGFTFTLALYAPLLYMVRWLDGTLRKQYSAVAESNSLLARQKEELARSNTELEQFAYTASHDLQEPLRKIQAFGDRLAKKYSDSLGDDGLMYLERMQDASARMRILIQDLLAFSRVSTKGNPFVEVDLNGTAAGVVRDLEVRIKESGGRVELGQLATLEADPLQMRQVLQNLIGNALKFAKPETPPLVKVRALVRGDKLDLSVEDNGIGFDEQYAVKVFDVFQRLHGRGEFEGTGMGLAIVRKIAERHGGIAKAFSEAGKGATFVVSLPLKQQEPDENPFNTTDISELKREQLTAKAATPLTLET